MVVTMIAMGMMQVSIHQVVHMIAMGYSLMTAAWPMHMSCRMTATLMSRRATVRVLAAHLQGMLIDMVAMYMMQMAIVKIIDVTIMLDGSMATARLMLVIVALVLLAGAHGFLPTRL